MLLVERGDFPDRAFLAQDHLRNARTDVGLDHRTLVSSPENPGCSNWRTNRCGWRIGSALGSNAYTLGGGTRIYGAQAWRFVPEDFRMASTYGVPDAARWPTGRSATTISSRSIPRRSGRSAFAVLLMATPGWLGSRPFQCPPCHSRHRDSGWRPVP